MRQRQLLELSNKRRTGMNGTKVDTLKVPGASLYYTVRGAGPILLMLLRPPRAEEFDISYTGTPAWDIGRPQPVFLALAESGEIRGRVLDACCGTGEPAL